MKRIGLFGGTFNPIHFGHLRGAEEVRETFDLQQVVFIPAAVPPHKTMEDVIEGAPRLEMVRLATLTNPCFAVSDVELKRPGKSYTIDTLRSFQDRDLDPLFFILGREAFVEIETWKDFRSLFSLCNFIVMTPRGFEKAPGLRPLPEFLAPDFCYNQEEKGWIHRSGHTLHFSEITFLDISSTKVREMIERGESVKYLIPPEVEAFLQERGLYRKKKGSV